MIVFWACVIQGWWWKKKTEKSRKIIKTKKDSVGKQIIMLVGSPLLSGME